MAQNLAPIALFVYKRPAHTAQTIEHLLRNPEFAASELHVFADGAKHEHDQVAVAKTRDVVRSFQLANLQLHEQTHNQGLGKSIIGGVTQLCADYGRTIVLEDDLLVARGFLDYMNRALDQYANTPQVMQICGHIFPFRQAPGTGDAFFLPITSTYGWGVWQRSWRQLDRANIGVEALRTDRQLRRRFDLDGAYPYSKMMFDCLEGKMDVWAIRWWWSVFKLGGLCLYPKQSLIWNGGFDAASTNTQAADTYINDLHWSEERTVGVLPTEVEPDDGNYKLLRDYVAVNYGSLTARTRRQWSKFRHKLSARSQRLMSESGSA